MNKILIIGMVLFLLLPTVFFSCITKNPECTRIKEIGQCTSGSILKSAICAVRLDNEEVTTVHAPTMVGRQMCRESKHHYWVYTH